MGLERLTRRQRDVYLFIREKIRSRGYGPTVREIGERFRIGSPNGVMCHLKALEKKGLITREPNMSRAIQLLNVSAHNDGIPLLGDIAAGNLSEAIEQAERFEFENWFPKRKNQFALRVKGDSMIEASIEDGDLVVCRRSRTAQRGDIVVAMTNEGEATLKYWYPEAKRVRLQPANSAMKPIYSRTAQVLGIVIGVVRKLK
ncbi:MAG: repressor LexA [Pirellulales bacterium]|nr:repressor LexA [Pirellulales bacterium]